MTQAAIDLAQAELTAPLGAVDAGGSAAPKLEAGATATAVWTPLPITLPATAPLMGAALDALRKQVRAQNRRAGGNFVNATLLPTAEAGRIAPASDFESRCRPA